MAYCNLKTFSILNFAMTEWFCYVTCFAKIFLLLLFHNRIPEKWDPEPGTLHLGFFTCDAGPRTHRQTF